MQKYKPNIMNIITRDPTRNVLHVHEQWDSISCFLWKVRGFFLDASV